MPLCEIYKKNPDYFHQVLDSSSEESLISVPGSNKSEDLDFLREMCRKDPELLFHQIFDGSSEKSSPLGSSSSESEDLYLLDLQAVLAKTDMQHSSDLELSEHKQHQEDFPPSESPPIIQESLLPITEKSREVFVFGAAQPPPSMQPQLQPAPSSLNPDK